MTCKKCSKPAEILNFDLTELLCMKCEDEFQVWIEKSPSGVKFHEFLNV